MSEDEIKNLPIINLPGSESWVAGYEWGQELEAAFPKQGGEDFAAAVQENGLGPIEGHRITALTMTQEGENDEAEWIWRFTLDDGTEWVATGWCDYTGWDCQSGLEYVTAGGSCD